MTSFDSRAFDGQSDGKKAAPGSTMVSISQVVEDRSVIDACDAFHNAIATGDFKGYCQGKSRSADSERDRQVWGLMKVREFIAYLPPTPLSTPSSIPFPTLFQPNSIHFVVIN